MNRAATVAPEFVPSSQMVWQKLHQQLQLSPEPHDSSSASPSSSATSSTATSPRRNREDSSVLWQTELDVGVMWWSERLAEAGVSASQLQCFEDELFRLLSKKFCGHWYPQESLRGSAYRSVSFDFRLDNAISRACAAAKIDCVHDKLPFHTVMWINPGKVSVRTSKTQWDDDGDSTVLYSRKK